MKPLDRLLRLHAKPDSSHMENAIDDVLKRDGARIGACLAGEQPAGSRLRYGPRFAVAAAVLFGVVGIGLYAIFPIQTVSPPEALPPKRVAAIPPAQRTATQGTDAGPARQFAVASVRSVPLGPQINNGFKCLGVDGLLGEPPDRQDATARRGRCTGQVVSVVQLVNMAYASKAENVFPMYRMAGLPLDPNTYFQIEAVADDPERVTKGELKLMLQTLLEDRFKARVHTETRQVDGYVVTIAKSGIKFKEKSGEPRGGPGEPRLDGIYTMGGVTRFLGFLLSSASALGSMPVVDRTGLTGTYAIKFELEEIRVPAPQTVGPRGGGGADVKGPPRQFTTPVPKAVEDQLGLHLERAKVPVEFIVIDHLEMPTQN
jgi:uncharacterized protein (TIGR03435 family)